MEKVKKLIKSCISGNERSKTILFDLQYDIIKTSISRYFKDPDTVKEVTQLSFIKLFEKINTFNSNNFDGWCYKLARNTALDYITKIKGVKISSITYCDEYSDIDMYTLNNLDEDLSLDDKESKTLTDLKLFIDKLTPQYKITINMYYFQEKTFKEISQFTGTTEATAKSNCRKARIRLLKMYNN